MFTLICIQMTLIASMERRYRFNLLGNGSISVVGQVKNEIYKKSKS